MSRYVEVPADRLIALLTEIGEAVASKGGSFGEGVKGKERTFEIAIPNRSISLLIYTSLAKNADTARECGEDAIRIVALGDPVQGRCPSLLPVKRIFRTAPQAGDRVETFLGRLKNEIRDSYKEALTIPNCPACAERAPMARRNGKRGEFWGCVRFPACRRTRKVEQAPSTPKPKPPRSLASLAAKHVVMDEYRAIADQYDCPMCEGTGHNDDCSAREPAYDIADLICRSNCAGCCSNGHKPIGIESEQLEMSVKAKSLISGGERR